MLSIGKEVEGRRGWAEGEPVEEVGGVRVSWGWRRSRTDGVALGAWGADPVRPGRGVLGGKAVKEMLGGGCEGRREGVCSLL